MPTKKTKQLNKSDTEGKETVFVIMPYGDWFDTYYTDIYQKAINKVGLKPLRLDDSNLPTVLVQEMVEMTQAAKIVLVDLTGNNPNVCYELGLAHAKDKPAIILTDQTENIPFDVSAFRVIIYNKNIPNWGAILTAKLVESLKNVIANPSKSSPSKLLRTTSNQESLPLLLDTESADKQRILRNEMIHDRLTASKRRISLTHNSSRIAPTEARTLINHYQKEGLPPSYIVNRLSRLGVPRTWLLNQMGLTPEKI